MNYNDQILEKKDFNFFKQLMYNIAVSICIILAVTLLLVYGFKFRLYEVLSDSQYPEFKTGDMVVVKDASSYEVGDIIKFNQEGMPVTHRLIAIMKDEGQTYYICHGDNVQSANPNPSNGSYTVPWQEDSQYIYSLINEGKTINQIENTAKNIQVMQKAHIEGKVVGHLNNYGTYFRFVKSHWLLLVTLVGAIWCVSTTLQNEIDIKKCRRLM